MLPQYIGVGNQSYSLAGAMTGWRAISPRPRNQLPTPVASALECYEYNVLVGSAASPERIHAIFDALSTYDMRGHPGAVHVCGDPDETEELIDVLTHTVSKVCGGEDQVLTLHGASFSSASSIATLIGAPPGYIGYNPGGSSFVSKLAKLTGADEPIGERPPRLILFRDVDKACQEVQETFASFVRNGYLELSSGGTVHRQDTLIVVTSRWAPPSNVETAQVVQIMIAAAEQGNPVPMCESLMAALQHVVIATPTPNETVSAASLRIGRAVLEQSGVCLPEHEKGFCRAAPSMIRAAWEAGKAYEGSTPSKIIKRAVAGAITFKMPANVAQVIAAAKSQKKKTAVTYSAEGVKVGLITPEQLASTTVTLPFLSSYLEAAGMSVPHADLWGDLQGIEHKLDEQVAGQSALTADMAMLMRSRSMTLSSPRSFFSALICGPSGSGKTRLAHALSLATQRPLLMRVCADWKTPEQVRDGLFGRAGDSLASVVKHSPALILLLDEADKSHVSIWDYLMQAIDKGEIRDPCSGHLISLRHAVILLTANYAAAAADELSATSDAADPPARDRQMRALVETSGLIAPHHAERLDRIYYMPALRGEAAIPMWVKMIEEVATTACLECLPSDALKIARLMEAEHEALGGQAGGRARRRLLEERIAEATEAACGNRAPPSCLLISENRIYAPADAPAAIPERKRYWALTEERESAFRKIYRGAEWLVDAFMDEMRMASMKPSAREPVSVILVTGPKGTGKTFLGQAASEAFGKGRAVKIECQQCRESHMVAPYLFGNPAGYQGSEIGGALTRPMLARRDQVVIFDEFTRAHSSFMDTVMNVLGEGTAMDMATRQNVDLRQCLFILTTNEYGEEVAEMVERLRAMGAHATEIEEEARRIMAPLMKAEHWDRIRLVLPITQPPGDEVVVEQALAEYGLQIDVTSDDYGCILASLANLAPSCGWRRRKKHAELKIAEMLARGRLRA